MSRPPKAIDNTTGHHTNADKEMRRAAEKAVLTGVEIRERAEVKRNPAAHEEFERVLELLTLAGKNDALIETVINRYCILMAECEAFEKRREKIDEAAMRLEQKLDELEGDATYTETKEAAKAISAMYATAISCDKQIQQKRRMLFDIEKENGFTVAAALRSIPKKIEKENPLVEALRDDDK